MKKCSHCKQMLCKSEFCKNKTRKDGLHHCCKKCHAEFRHLSYCVNREKEIENNQFWNHKNKEQFNSICRKHNAKRKRNLGFILMFPNPFDNSVLVDYHHITDVYVVAVPRELHKLYYGKNHREKMMEIVKQIYM